MRSAFRPLRVRVALFATLAVTAALVAAAAGLVLAVESTLLGRLRDAAVERVDEVADDIAAGADPAAASDAFPDVLVQVLDENGDVIDTVPEAAPFRVELDLELNESVSKPFLALDPPLDGRSAGDGTVVRQLSAEELILAQRTVESPEGTRTVVAISPLSGVSRSIDSVVTALWTGIPFLIAVVGFVCWHITGRTLRPVDAMTRRAEEISHSTLDERLPTPGTRDEIDRLAVTLNSMLARLEEAARRQREFVSDASHELRSPIAATRAQLEVALAHPETAAWDRVAADVLEETFRLERLVDDLLALARAEEMALRREEVDLRELLDEQLRRARDGRVTVEGTAPVLHGDRDQLERALANLLDNARRHARNRVVVTLGVREETIVVSVEDDGPGVPDAERELVFERFRRLEDGRERDAGGVGIGLALVSRAASNHGGSARCLGSALGGAKFEIALPAS
jgi:signal transduction histidine kinase